MKKIVLASSNKGKIKEFSEIFKKVGIEVVPQSEFDIPDAEETGLSFIENAILKARHCSHFTGLPSIADDSGLEVEALNGEPGIYSARYSGIHGDDNANNLKLLNNLSGISNRAAKFQCAIAYIKHEKDPTPLISVGELAGEIAKETSGENGFGYDPLFYIPEKQKTLAELPAAYKNKVSHRAVAMSRLLNLFQ